MNFDTYADIKRFVKSGFKENQAHEIVSTIAKYQDHELKNLATKIDIAEVKQEISEVKSELKQDIAELRQEISEVKSELKQDIAELRQEISEVKSELKQDIAELKQEISEVKSELKQDIAEVKSELKQDMAELKNQFERSKNETLKWVLGINLGIAGALISAIIACFKLFIP